MTVEEQLKDKIIKNFKSVRAFTQFINVPYSTIDTMIKKGISGTGISTVLKVCQALNIDVESIEAGEIKEKVSTPSTPNFEQKCNNPNNHDSSVFIQEDTKKRNELIKKIQVLDLDDLKIIEGTIDVMLKSAKYESAAAQQDLA